MAEKKENVRWYYVHYGALHQGTTMEGSTALAASVGKTGKVHILQIAQWECDILAGLKYNMSDAPFTNVVIRFYTEIEDIADACPTLEQHDLRGGLVTINKS
jgi:dipeptidase